MCKNSPGNSRELSGFLDAGVIQMNADLKRLANLFEWKDQVAKCHSSGLKVREWCRMHAISLYVCRTPPTQSCSSNAKTEKSDSYDSLWVCFYRSLCRCWSFLPSNEIGLVQPVSKAPVPQMIIKNGSTTSFAKMVTGSTLWIKLHLLERVKKNEFLKKRLKSVCNNLERMDDSFASSD